VSWGFTLADPQRRALDVDGVTEVAKAAQERFGHGSMAQEVGPFVIHEIGCNNGGVATMLLYQFEEEKEESDATGQE
jgi:hypothetical protein